MSADITSLISNGGIGLIFVLMLVASCGVPLPSELIMPFGGVLAATTHVSLAGVIVAGAAGDLGGALIAYSLSRKYGEPLLLGPGRHIGISSGHLDLAKRWFARFGLVAVPLGRVLPLLRAYVSFPAGVARVPVAQFAVMVAVCAVVWCSVLAGAGYELGHNYDRISGPLSKLALVMAVMLVGAVCWWFVRGRRRRVSA